jgi:hypothetical protein
MKQILHIFRKDARRFWPEIAISLAVIAVWVWAYPNQWLPVYGVPEGGIGASYAFAFRVVMQRVADALTFLVVVCWWILIARVVHDESLVGDRQFWLTRPYEWKKLLAAKVLFLAVFLYLPLVIAQCFLLVLAGFHPLSYVPGLLFNLLLITGILVLPLFALAAVTSTFVRMALTLLSIVLVLIAIVICCGSSPTTSANLPTEDHLSVPLIFCCVCGAAIVVQYAARRVWLSRILLVALPVVIVILGLFEADEAQVLRTYPRPSTTAAAPAQISFRPDALHQVFAGPAPLRASDIQINLPLEVSGVADGYAVSPDNVKVTIEAPDGRYWTLPWQAVYERKDLPGSQGYQVAFTMSRAHFYQLKSAPVALQLALAVTELRSGAVRRISLPTRDFDVPDFGVCSPRTDWRSEEIVGLACRAALRQPDLTYINVVWSDTPCSLSQPGPNPGVQGGGWAGTLSSEPAEFGIASVKNLPFDLSNKAETDQRILSQQRYLCPGSPVSFTQYHLVRRTQIDLTIPDFHFPALTLAPEASRGL